MCSDEDINTIDITGDIDKDKGVLLSAPLPAALRRAI